MNKFEKVYHSDEILELLDDCYFHPERDKVYPKTEIKYAAQCAFLRLWNMYLLECGGEVYESKDIRRIVYKELLPEDLDNAVLLCGALGKTNDLAYLSQMILFQVIARLGNYEAILKTVTVCPHSRKIKMPAEVCA